MRNEEYADNPSVSAVGDGVSTSRANLNKTI